MLLDKIFSFYLFFNNLPKYLFPDEKRLLKYVPSKYHRQATTLLKQFDNRGNELTWNSNGTIFIDQTSIPESNMFELFPNLFKPKKKKTLQGFEDFVQKISEMGLLHLTLQRSLTQKLNSLEMENKNVNWWFLD